MFGAVPVAFQSTLENQRGTNQQYVSLRNAVPAKFLRTAETPNSATATAPVITTSTKHGSSMQNKEKQRDQALRHDAAIYYGAAHIPWMVENVFHHA